MPNDEMREVMHGSAGALAGHDWFSGDPLKSNPQKAQCGCVYFIRDVASGLVKIGETQDLSRRFLDLQGEVRGRIELLHFILTDRPYELEGAVHALYGGLRVPRSEWFAVAWPDPAGFHRVKSWTFVERPVAAPTQPGPVVEVSDATPAEDQPVGWLAENRRARYSADAYGLLATAMPHVDDPDLRAQIAALMAVLQPSLSKESPDALVERARNFVEDSRRRVANDRVRAERLESIRRTLGQPERPPQGGA